MDELRERIARITDPDIFHPNGDGCADIVGARVEELAQADAILAEIGRTHAVVPKEMPNATAWAICQEADICGSDPCGKCPAEEICHGEPSIRGCRLMARNAYRAALKAATPPASTGGGEGG